MKRISLMALVVVVPLLMGHLKEVREKSELETSNLKPYEQVRKYLDENGLAREEFREAHYFFLDTIEREVHYNRSYDFGGELFVEQYGLSGDVTQHKNGEFILLEMSPSMFFWRETWYFDPYRDGFNGNEIKYSDWLKKFPEPKKSVDYIPEEELRI